MSCSEWEEVQLVDIVSKLGDGLHGTPQYSENGEYYFINGNNLKNGRLVIDSNTKRVDESQFLKYQKELNDRTIFVSINGTLGNIALYDNEKVILGKSACYFNVNKDVCKNFVRYSLEGKIFKNYISNYSSGTTIRNLSLKAMREYPISLPPFEEQNKIASILSSLDDKIELNNQMNETLEEIAQTLFKRWFVDFEFPNEEGFPYKSSGGEMVPSELGEIPKGWEVGIIDDIADVIGGGTPSKKVDEYYTAYGIPWITPKDLSGYNNKFIERGALDITDLGLKRGSARIMPRGTVLFSSRAPIGYLAISKNEVTTNQGFKSLVSKSYMGTEYLYYLMKHIKSDIENHATGSTFKEVSGSLLKGYSIILSDKNVVMKYENLVSTLSKQILKNEEETESLIKTRDLLLPKLMSGEIRV